MRVSLGPLRSSEKSHSKKDYPEHQRHIDKSTKRI